MKKCYIAGFIGDLPKEVYEKNFNDAKSEVAALGYEPISPLDLPHMHNRTWSNYMRGDMIEMLKCDAVYALRNWRKSVGARIEIETALSVGLDIIQQQTLPK